MAKTQPQNPVQAFQALEERRKQEQLAKDGREFTQMDAVAESLFGKPDSPEGAFVRRQWEWLQTKEGYKRERDQALLMMRQTAQRIFEATKKRMEARHATHEQTRAALKDLSEKFQSTVGTVGQAVKMTENPYAKDKENAPDVPAAKKEVMEIDEAMTFNRFANFLNTLDVDEVITMINEDQTYIMMLVEEMQYDGRSLVDMVPKGFGFENQDKALDGSRIGKLNPENTVNENYKHNLEHLRRFILGLPEKDGKKKSTNRQNAEMVLWLEIVRALSQEQKENLIITFLKSGDPEAAQQAQNFMTTCVAAGVMTVEDVHKMVESSKQPNAPLHEYFAKLPNDLEKRLRDAVEVRDEVKKEIEEAAQKLETPQVDNAATHFLTFNNMVAGRVAEIGLLTFGINFVLDIADRIRRRHEPERKETLGQSIVKGVGDAFKDRNVWLGAAEMAWGTNVVYPWIRAAMLSKSGEEEDMLAEYKEARFLREQVRNRPSFGKYFIENYDDMFGIAKKNADQESPLKKQGERREFEIYPGDLKLLPEGQRMTPERATQLGFNSMDEAEAMMSRMFHICSKVLKNKTGNKLATANDVEKYFNEHVYPDVVHSEHEHRT